MERDKERERFFEHQQNNKEASNSCKLKASFLGPLKHSHPLGPIDLGQPSSGRMLQVLAMETPNYMSQMMTQRAAQRLLDPQWPFRISAGILRRLFLIFRPVS